MPTNTYVALDKVTVGTATSTITFSSIPSGYTDLVIVFSGSSTANDFFSIRFNNDSGSNYSLTDLYGTGSAAYSTRQTNQTKISRNECVGQSNAIIQINNYSNTTTYKTTLSRSNSATDAAFAVVGLWRSTAAINRVDLIHDGSTFVSGSTFSLYGIKAEVGGSTPKAVGGTVTSDATYYYHTFTSSGNFTPSQSLTCDYLVVAGGGSGGIGAGGGGGGGGAGGYRTATAQSFTSGTIYAMLVGAGGAGVSDRTIRNTSGGNSSIIGSGFTAFSATGGGAGGNENASNLAVTGGSGGGGAAGSYPSGAAGNAGGYTPVEGYAGASGSGSSPYPGGGGGGAGAAGSGKNGGNGLYTAISGGATTGAGQLSGGNYYFAGGGASVDYVPYGGSGAGTAGLGGGGAGKLAGGTNNPNGTANTGGGGGGSGDNGTTYSGNGGSGIVIVRYAK